MHTREASRNLIISKAPSTNTSARHYLTSSQGRYRGDSSGLYGTTIKTSPGKPRHIRLLPNLEVQNPQETTYSKKGWLKSTRMVIAEKLQREKHEPVDCSARDDVSQSREWALVKNNNAENWIDLKLQE